MNAIETLQNQLKREQDSSNTFRLSLKKKDDTIGQLTTQLKVCKPSGKLFIIFSFVIMKNGYQPALSKPFSVLLVKACFLISIM